jgi:hypothetical protein
MNIAKPRRQNDRRGARHVLTATLDRERAFSDRVSVSAGQRDTHRIADAFHERSLFQLSGAAKVEDVMQSRLDVGRSGALGCPVHMQHLSEE